MKALKTAWILAIVVFAGGFAYLWFTDVPELKAEPMKPEVIREQGKPPVLTTGPMTFDLAEPAGADDPCPKSC